MRSFGPFLCMFLVGCGGGAKNTGDGGSSADPKSKEAAVQVLNDFLAAAEAKDYKKAAQLHIDPTEVEKHCRQMLESKEISKQGIDILAAKGTWGTMLAASQDDRLKVRVGRIAKALNLGFEDLYILDIEPQAFAVFAWRDKQLRIVRLSGLRRLEGGEAPSEQQ